MRYTPVILFLLSTSFGQPSLAQSKEVGFLIDTTIALMKEQSVLKDSVNWVQMKKEMISRTQGRNDSADLQQAMGYLYQSLDDAHGGLRFKGKRFSWFPPMPAPDDSLENEFKKGNLIKTQLLAQRIGYLRIPSMRHAYRDSLALHLNKSLCYLLENNIKGLVIDLRVNGGGSITPMLLGVQQLLGNNKVGGLQSNENSIDIYMKNNAVYYDTSIRLSFKPACSIDAGQLPVVLLSSHETGSSGEMLLLAFKGRANTLIMGVPTYGLTSSLSWNVINDSTQIGIATGWMKDRMGNAYKNGVKPHTHVEAVNNMNDIANDTKVLKAAEYMVQYYQ
jgi:carboxyl-terminal processing protease